MIDIWTLRVSISKVLLSLFGYIFPALSSAQAVVTNDEDGLREWLTYWSVFSCFYFVEAWFDAVLYRFPFYYEMKIISVLWLTLPRFQGAFRIYTYAIQPYFEANEHIIDKQINDITDEFKIRATRQLRNIIWQILMAPNDGLITTSMKTIGINLLASTMNIETSEKNEPIPQSLQKIDKKLISDFTALLEDGIYVTVGITPIQEFKSNTQTSNPINILSK
eukprot:gene4809-9590_t